MEAALVGGCRCGAIRYACSEPARTTLRCYCRDCQRATGGACASSAVVSRAALSLTRGRPARYESRAESGHTVHREFCPACGSPLFAGSSGHPQTVGVYLGSLDDATDLVPATNVWTGSRPPWGLLDPGLESFERGRPRAED